jgi:virginiamycin B lyase
MALRFQFPAAVAGTLVLAACAGSHSAGGFAPQTLQPTTAGVAAANPSTVPMTYSIKVPAAKGAAGTAAQRHEDFVSASTQSIEFQVYKTKKRHTPSTLISTMVVALNAGAKGCTGSGARICTGTINLPPPSVDIVATTYDLKPAGKKISKKAKQLAIASIAGQTVKAGKKLAFTLGGIPATFAMTIPNATPPPVSGVETAEVYGMAPSNANISIKAYDADGNFIVTDAYVNAAGKSTGIAMSVTPSQKSCTSPVLQADTNEADTSITVTAPPKIGVFFNYGTNGIAAAFSTPGYCSFDVAASLGSNAVQHGRFELSGPMLTEYPLPSSSSSPASPEAIVVGPDNNIWFTDLAGVRTFNVITKAITTYTVPTTPQGIASYGGSLWINGYGHLIQMSTAGTIVNDFTNSPSPGNGPNNQLVLGPDGNFWFTEFMSQKVAKVSLTGSLTEYGVPGTGNPSGISMAGGQLWFTTNADQGLLSITTSGTQKHYTLPANTYPNFMVTGPDGKLWFASCNGTMNRLAVPTSSTLAPTVFTVPPHGAVPGRVRGIAAGPNADMWGADAAGNLDRVPLTATNSSQVTAVAVSEAAQWLTLGPDGAIWFTESTPTGNGKIGRLVP